MQCNSQWRTLAVGLALVAVSGCSLYRTTVHTGIAPGPVEISRSKATYIGGLVSTSPMHAQEECAAAGVATVETEHSVSNQLLAVLTLGIYTPVTVRIRCGAVGSDEDLDEERSAEDDEKGPEPAPITAAPARITTVPNPSYAEVRDILTEIRGVGCETAVFAWTATRSLEATCVD
jgi:hypothetical protein